MQFRLKILAAAFSEAPCRSSIELGRSLLRTAAAGSRIAPENKLILSLNKEFRKKAWYSDLARELVNDSTE